MRVLFEGGPLDGQLRELAELPSQYVVPVEPSALDWSMFTANPVPLVSLPMRTVLYTLERRASGRLVYVL
jgi:hypothetical protein